MHFQKLFSLKLSLLGALGLVILAGCDNKKNSSPEAYPQALQKSFMTSCLSASGENQKACKCALEQLEKEVSLADLQNYEALLKEKKEQGSPLHEKITRLVHSCR